VSPARRVHFLLCQLFLGLALLQFFLAGLGVFRAKPHGSEHLYESSAFDAHRAVGDVTQIVALLILVAAVLARGRVRLSLALFVLAVIQGVLPSLADDVPGIAALHPINGLVLIAIAHFLTRPAREAEAPAAAGPPESATPTGTPPVT
jgi:Family of unknown function (DUF6220)